MDTYFAPAKRTERRKFENQITNISHNPIMDSLLKAAAGLLVVLNEDRQIVSINPSFLEALGVKDIQEVLGFRLGETLHCAHAFKEPNGCGTTEYCQSCGAAIATMTAINNDQITEQTCALLTDKNGEIDNTCLLIKAVPITLDGQRWILIYAQDITQQHFWTNLEHLFFHDINNILTSVSGNLELLEATFEDSDELLAIQTGVNRLIREIRMQKDLSQRKTADHNISLSNTCLKEIRKEIHTVVNGHASSYKKNIVEEWPIENIQIKTDELLVSRILSNMIINAFEASENNQSIRLTVQITNNHIIWEVWNPANIPAGIQKRIFQKHFTTKFCSGRGLGTYSMKLFGETYLKGEVSFTSSSKEGTCFTFKLPK